MPENPEKITKFTIDVRDLEISGYAVVSQAYLEHLERIKATAIAVAVGDEPVSELAEIVGRR